MLLACSVQAADAAEVAVQAAADADTSLLAPLTPNGRAQTMRASTTGSAFVRFDVPSTTTKLLRAVLQLPVAQANGGTIQLQLTQPGWSETSVTYLAPPARIGSSIATPGAPVGAGTITAVDVTGSVVAGGKVSFAIDRQALDAATFKTRETGTGPRLVVTYAGAAQHGLRQGLLARARRRGNRTLQRDRRPRQAARRSGHRHRTVRRCLWLAPVLPRRTSRLPTTPAVSPRIW